jgi:hypothetical protein
LPTLRPAQVELINGIETFSGIRIEPAREKLKKLFDSGGGHG